MKNPRNNFMKFIKTHAKTIYRWLPAVLWMIIIFLLSHQSNLKSNLDKEWDLILRKIAHLIEYAILYLLLIRSFNPKQKKIKLKAFVIAFLYACLDEYHQSFILGRSGCLKDVLIDLLGITSAVLFKSSTSRN